MPVSSSSALHVSLSLHTSESSSPYIPPRSQWPIAGQDDDDDDDDAWGSASTSSKSRWLTAMAAWHGSRSAARVAVATADGSCWLFSQSDNAATPPRRAQGRPPSPTPSIASTRSHRESHPPPFAGFHHHSNAPPEPVVSPTSPTSTNLASTSAWKPTSPDARQQQGFDALESRLESQYHSGAGHGSAPSNRDSVVGSFMETLGLSKHAPHHHNHHGSHHGSHASPSPSRRESKAATPSETSRAPSRAAAGTQASSSRRASHTRSSAIAGPSTAASTLLSLSVPAGDGSHESGRMSRSVSRSSRREQEPQYEPPSPPAPTPLRSVKAYARLTASSADTSPIVAMVTCSLASAESPDTLVLLHRRGWMTAISIEDGTVLGDLDLASVSAPVENKDKAAPPASLSASSGGGGLVASTLAALRSHSNSPAPAAAKSHLSAPVQPGSRPGSALLRRALTNDAPPLEQAAQEKRKQRAVSSLASMHLVASLDGVTLLACFDAAEKRLLFIALRPAAGGAASLSVIEVADLHGCSRERCPSFAVEGDAVKVAHVNEEKESVTVHRFQVTMAAGNATVDKAGFAKLTIPEDAGGQVQRCSLLTAGTLLGHAAGERLVLLSSAACDSLGVVKSIHVPELQDFEVISPSYALARTKTTTKLISIDADSLTLLNDVPGIDVAAHSGQLLLSASAAPECLTLQSLLDSRDLYASSPVQPAISALLPLSMERILALTSTGHLTLATLNDLLANRLPTPNQPPSTSAAHPAARATMLRQVTNPRNSSTKHILAAFSTGAVAFWDLATLRLQAEWSLFTAPVLDGLCVVFGQEDNTLRLHGCLALASTDGTVAILALDGLKLLYLLPGRGEEAPLDWLAVRADELMLVYRDGRARVWDVATQELRRSMGLDQAEGMLSDGRGSWSRYDVGVEREVAQSGVLSAVSPSVACDTPLMGANLKKGIDAASKAAGAHEGMAKPKAVRPGSATSTSGASRVQSILRPLMAALWPSGIDDEMDQAIASLFEPALDLGTAMKLGSASSSTQPGSLRRHYHSTTSSLKASSSTNASRFLALTAMLKVLARSKAGTNADRCISWLSTSAPRTSPLNPALLALHLVDPTPEIRSAAEELLEARIAMMSAEEVDTLVVSWRSLLPTAHSSSPRAAQSLSLLGFLCLKRYALVDPALLRDVAEAVFHSLSSAHSPQALRLPALWLCVQGFSVWQNYVDAMALLRSLFTLAIDTHDDVTASQAAKDAVIAIAEEHTPLFMTTLNLDLLALSGGDGHAPSSSTAANGVRTMQLLSFLVSLRPSLLAPSLPRISEAVVKSLDPTTSSSSNAGSSSSPKPNAPALPGPSTTQRDLLLPSATHLISTLVRAYRTLAFHGSTQRLAVGTHEGAIVMYELRTATRLFVLEGGHGSQAHGHAHHSTQRGPLTLLSFSPDGRRLVSLSLTEGKALAWKVGSSLASWLLRPGGVPRQGGGSGVGGGGKQQQPGAEPAYKVWRFTPRSGEDDEALRCEWVGEKRCEIEVGADGHKRERTLFDVE
ncbi:hypothetical protein BDZ90DRAFT_263340 [Jaminaea rosea]|uniref:WD40 repeat-like protein n=1 Tax=Jaminaea rosea TaxID=1569628 RepID=A0A316UGX7_9BASI|nr:hypothetical protein BDZ90DRAFT_263340 [Jaminaea rosea]PWN24499.1 hypothetical protein BDZ90DRAFT_263340 [Jaminaea rosea]